MCRIHRLGQKLECFIYRFVSAGTIEEAMYKREVTKEMNAKRVIDNEDIDNQINNHETLFELSEADNENESYHDEKNTIEDDDLLIRLIGTNGSLVKKVHPHHELLLSHGVSEKVSAPDSAPAIISETQRAPKKRRLSKIINSDCSHRRLEISRRAAKVLKMTNSTINDHIMPKALNKK